VTRLIFLFLVLVAHGFAQGMWPFGGGSDAKRIQGKAVVAPLTCSDGEQLTWVTANSRFECAAAGGAGSGITTLNTLTGDTQTFATPGTTGTAPNWVSSGTAHTLHIPMASASSVTAGLVTKAWYDTVVTAAGTLTSNAPVIGGGSKAVAVGTASGNTTEFGTITGTKTANKQLAFDASGNIIASATDIGGSGSGATAVSGLTDNKVTVSGAIYTIAAGVWHCLDSSGVMQAYLLSEGYVERTTGTTAGTLRFGVNCNNGSPIVVARIPTAITLGNYTCTGVTCTSSDTYAEGDWALADAVVGGSLGTPTDRRSLGGTARYIGQNGVVIAGDKASANCAFVDCLGTAATHTAKKTFGPDATNAGINVGSYAGNPSSLTNGDLWYNSTGNVLNARINGATVSLGAGGTPAGSNTELQMNNAGAFGGATGYTYDTTNKVGVITSSASGAGHRVHSNIGVSSGRLGYTEACLDSNPFCGRLLTTWSAFADGNTTNRTGLIYRNNNDTVNIIHMQSSSEVVIGGTTGTAPIGADGGSAGWMRISAGGASWFAGAATAGRGLVSIAAAPTNLTGQTGDVAAYNLMAASHTAGTYRVCGALSITTVLVASMSGWSLTWRDLASGSDVTNNIVWDNNGTLTATPSTATQTGISMVCKVINSAGTSAISIDPGDVSTAAYTSAFTVERLK